MLINLAKNVVASIKSHTHKSTTPRSTVIDEAADYAAKIVNDAIESGALKGEDEIIDAYFKNYEHYKAHYAL